MNRTAVGVGFAVCTALISGVAIFVNSYAVKQVPDAALFTTLKNGAAALILLTLALAVLRPAQARAIPRRSWVGVAAVGVVGGSIPFLLFFGGLAMASAPSAAFIHKTLFVWVAILAVPFLGERLGRIQLAAIATLLASQVLIAPPQGVTLGVGELMIGAATLFWAVEVVVARRLLANVPVAVLGVGRMGIGLIVLVGYLGFTGRLGMVAALTADQWIWALGTGAILAGYVATWLSALRRAPATVVTSVLVLGAPVTAALDAIARGAVPPPTVLGGYVLVGIAVTLVVAGLLWPARRTRALAA